MSYDHLDIDLSEMTTAAIVGKNGAGKTSLIRALTMALWGETNGVEDPFNDAFQELTVGAEFTVKGVAFRVQRYMNREGRGSTLALVQTGLPVDVSVRKHTIAETQAKIDRLVGLSWDGVKSGPIMMQGDGSPLMSLKPVERKELLIKLFGVEKYEPYHKEASDRAAAYSRDAKQYESELLNLDSIITEEVAANANLVNAKYDMVIATEARDKTATEMTAVRERQVAAQEQSRHLETLRQTVTTTKSRIESDEKEHARLLRQISDAHQNADVEEPTFEPLEEFDEEEIKRARGIVTVLRKEADERAGLEGKVPLLKEQLDRSRKMAAIVKTVPCGGEGIYATCRFLTSAPRTEDIEAQQQEVANIEQKISLLASNAQASQALVDFEHAMTAVNAQAAEKTRRETVLAQWTLKKANAEQLVKTGQNGLTRLETQIARDQSVLARAVAQVAQFTGDVENVDALEVEVASLRIQVEEQTRSIDMVYQPAVRSAEDTLARIEEAKTQRTDIERKWKEASGKAEVHALVAKAFHRDGIPTLIVENGIPIIEERANEILARMPDNYRVKILTQRANKKGGMMDKVNIVVETNGKARPYGNLSGGEQFRVNFALRVAIGRVLSHRSDASIETLILDEGWGSQDKDGVEALLESLAAVQDEFGLILVITHQDVVIQRFETRIEVSRPEGGFSTYTIVG
jgi:DNA repair exonuclease SbcCD ATPase subunit